MTTTAIAIADRITQLIIKEWEAQGHNLTGEFIRQIDYDIKQDGDSVRLLIYDNTERGYGKILDDGVQADRIKYPYARARIEGLTNYGKLRLGLQDKQARSFAFAVATKHAREGMPLPSSSRFSRTGKRTKFVEDATKEITKIVQEEVNKTVRQWLSQLQQI